MTGSNSISVTVDNILGAIRVGELGSGTADLYTATGELEVGVPHGTAAWLDARSSTGRMHNYLEAPDAPERSDRTVKVRPPMPSSPLP
jgi:hypothetical protein